MINTAADKISLTNTHHTMHYFRQASEAGTELFHSQHIWSETQTPSACAVTHPFP